MGGLWVNFLPNVRRRPASVAAESADQHPRPLRHRRMRIPVPRRQPPGGHSLVSCIFSGLLSAPGIINRSQLQRPEGDATRFRPSSTRRWQAQGALRCDARPPAGRGESLKLHAELGREMTRRHGRPPQRRLASRPTPRSANCRSRPPAARLPTPALVHEAALFARALHDMFPMAKAILKGARPGRLPRGPLQAGVRPQRYPRRRPGRAPPRGRGVGRSLRGQQPQVAQVDAGQVRGQGRADAEL